MNENMNLENFDKLLHNRRILQAISDITFSYYSLNKRYPVDSIISNFQSFELADKYARYIEGIKRIIQQYENEGAENELFSNK